MRPRARRYSIRSHLTSRGRQLWARQLRMRSSRGVVSPEPGIKALVRVYEKLLAGVWSDKGLFELAGYEYRKIGSRKVFKFHMHLVAERETPGGIHADLDHRRLIPGWVKLAVFRRDKGQCVKCGARDNLHFDHDLPFSKGGASITPDNVKLLCARHNLEKGARIE